MPRELVFVHGRAQEGLPPLEEKHKWIGYLEEGLAKSGLELPIGETSIHFPYYGNTLVQLVAGRDPKDVAKVLVRGIEGDEGAQVFLEAFVAELQQKVQLTPAEIEAATHASDEAVLVERGLQNAGFVLAILRALDAHAPWASSAAISLATNDVYQYLHNDNISGPIDEGVVAAVTPGAETVVVAHSLGTIIAYRLLRDRGESSGWKIPHFITVGSPLGIGTIKSALGRIKWPAVVGSWSNAYDTHDVVALRSLEPEWFDVQPPIKNLAVENDTENKHGISGYLRDPDVAKWIHAALVEGDA
ncbi:hypothetical protein ABZ477_13535 [Microbacterium sp. NPDC019599]|uniref:hypothetical protein n=1 Tax=Microbacterium sp. NPDC019599 TaxID=3154690 RepID=UPI0033EB2873